MGSLVFSMERSALFRQRDALQAVVHRWTRGCLQKGCTDAHCNQRGGPHTNKSVDKLNSTVAAWCVFAQYRLCISSRQGLFRSSQKCLQDAMIQAPRHRQNTTEDSKDVLSSWNPKKAMQKLVRVLIKKQAPLYPSHLELVEIAPHNWIEHTEDRMLNFRTNEYTWM